VLSTITYAMTILSLIGSMCLSNPTEQTFAKSTQQVFRAETMPATTYYRPVYIENKIDSRVDINYTLTRTYEPTLSIDVYQN
jgi:hypothetical protein